MSECVPPIFRGESTCVMGFAMRKAVEILIHWPMLAKAAIGLVIMTFVIATASALGAENFAASFGINLIADAIFFGFYAGAFPMAIYVGYLWEARFGGTWVAIAIGVAVLVGSLAAGDLLSEALGVSDRISGILGRAG